MTTFEKMRVHGLAALIMTLAACSSGGGGGSLPPPGSPGAGEAACRPGVNCPVEVRTPVREGDPRPRGEQRTGGAETRVAPPAAVGGATSGGSLLGANSYVGGATAGQQYQSVPYTGNAVVDARQGYQSTAPFPSSWTGGDDGQGRRFTDAFDDLMMQELKSQMRLLPAGDYRQKSEKFAAAIKDFDVWTKSGAVRMKIAVVDADLAPGMVVAVLAGQMNCTGSEGAPSGATKACVAELKQVELNNGVRLKGGLAATVMCVDKGNSCQHKIVRIDQLDDKGIPCKSAFAIHRYGDASMMSDNNCLLRATHPGSNPNEAAICKYLDNTSKCVQQHSRDARDRAVGRCDLYPRAHSLGLKTWAVAGGFGGFEVMLEGTPDVRQPQYRDVMLLRGPTIVPGGGWVYGPVQDPLEILGFTKNIANNTDPMNWYASSAEGFASLITNVQLTSNNGRGQIELRFSFNEQTSFPVTVRTAAFPTMSVDLLRHLMPKGNRSVRCDADYFRSLADAQIPKDPCCVEFYNNPRQFPNRQNVCCGKDMVSTDLQHKACDGEPEVLK